MTVGVSQGQIFEEDDVLEGSNNIEMSVADLLRRWGEEMTAMGIS